jgi:uncharacterized protein YcnI
MPRSSKLLLASAAAALVGASAAAAHVTVNPNKVPAESFARFDVRVPNERPDASTVEVTLQLPPGLVLVSFQPKPGWKRTVEMEQLTEPIEVFGEQVTERIASVTWSGGEIAPGEFDEFGMSARMPAEEGAELVFPSIQTYSSGEVVRWIGPPDADTPAPRVTLEAAESEEEHAETPAATTPAETTPTETAAESADGEAEDVEDRANLALGVGIAGLLAGLGGLVGFGLARRRS